MNKVIIIVFLSALTLSCQTKLKVMVDIFDLEVLESTSQYKKSELSFLEKKIAIDLSADSLSAFKNRVLHTAESDFKNFDEMLSLDLPVGFKESLLDEFDKELSKEIDAAISFYEKAANQITAYKAFPEREEYQRKAMKYKFIGDDYLGKADSLVEVVYESYGEFLDDVESKKLKVAGRKIVQSVKKSVSNKTSSFGQSIVADRLASVVVAAPEKYWSKYGKNEVLSIHKTERNRRSGHAPSRINKTVVRGFMGNLDVAIKMERPGEFTVKGVRMDADAALKASSRVVNQAIKYASGGVIGSVQGTVDSVPIEAVDLANSVINQTQLEDLQTRSEELRNEILKELFVKQKAIQNSNNDAQKKKQLVDQLKEEIESYKLKLKQLK